MGVVLEGHWLLLGVGHRTSRCVEGTLVGPGVPSSSDGTSPRGRDAAGPAAGAMSRAGRDDRSRDNARGSSARWRPCRRCPRTRDVRSADGRPSSRGRPRSRSWWVPSPSLSPRARSSSAWPTTCRRRPPGGRSRLRGHRRRRRGATSLARRRLVAARRRAHPHARRRSRTTGPATPSWWIARLAAGRRGPRCGSGPGCGWSATAPWRRCCRCGCPTARDPLALAARLVGRRGGQRCSRPPDGR